jgi:predicted TIM-barrel fold metal-dependent hydrolase
MDRIFYRNSATDRLDPSITQPPSSYVRGRVYGCFFADDFGVQVRDYIGIDQITFETDYPHNDSTFPNSRAYAQKALAGLADQEIDKIIRGNAIAMLGLPETLPTASAVVH